MIWEETEHAVVWKNLPNLQVHSFFFLNYRRSIIVPFSVVPKGSS